MTAAERVEKLRSGLQSRKAHAQAMFSQIDTTAADRPRLPEDLESMLQRIRSQVSASCESETPANASLPYGTKNVTPDRGC